MTQRSIAERGVESVEASFAAQRALGSVALAQDQARDVWVPHGLQGIGQDLRLAIRSLRATRIVSAIAILSLGLGIGANTAIFSLVNSLILRTLPVVQPQRLVTLSSGTTVDQWGSQQFSYAIWEEIQRRAALFDGAFTWAGAQFNLSQAGETQPVAGFVASGDFFATLGVPALLGRTFTTADDVRGGGPAGPVAVISYGFWQRRFGGSANVIGTPLVIGTTPYTIVGVTPPEFFGVEVGQAFDIAVPILSRIPAGAKDPIIDSRSTLGLRIVLRLKPGQSLEAAEATLRGLQPQIREGAMPEDFPQLKDSFLKEPLMLVSAAAGSSALRLRYQRPLLTILVVVALVLLVACANIANLLLARATARRHELSVRVALGASRWRLARQLLIESLVLSSLGAGVGLLFASWSSRLLLGQLSTSVSRVSLDLSLDWRMLSFTAAVTIATALLFGTIPALRAARSAPIDAMKEHGRGAAGDAGMSLSSGLIAAQIALSLVLLVAAGLFIRSFERIATRQLGFDKDRVLVVTVDARRALVDPPGRTQFYQRLVNTV
jgi:putative ABC transport system permease protein